eukprot:TRINITY_DN15178_c0_g1_i1.p1 TRINITY_DN15178_c0_g1~~TRINITY_DN15178_c0_g1_i1.p1  ORF type:complete len:208 (+),score=63.49 TRINITY_DN15178_c0_g1_i1:60-626(+)
MEDALASLPKKKGFVKAACLTGEWGVGYKEEAVERESVSVTTGTGEGSDAAKPPAPPAEERKPLWELLQESREQQDLPSDAAPAERELEGAEADFHRQMEADRKAQLLERQREEKKQLKEFESEVAKKQKEEEASLMKARLETNVFDIRQELKRPTDASALEVEVIPKKKRRRKEKSKGDGGGGLVDY